MTGVRRPALFGAAVAAGLAAFALDGAAPSAVRPAAAAASENRAVVVVDTGQEVRRVCVRFAEDSISGAEALVLARTDPVFREYAGKGKAVCALCGVGCPADDSCLTCDPAGRYWTYSRAPRGSTSFSLSGAGASSTRVRDGDVEGWRWSTGAKPAYVSVDSVCGPAPAAATTTSSSTVGAAGSSTTTIATTKAGVARDGAGTTSTTGRARGLGTTGSPAPDAAGSTDPTNPSGTGSGTSTSLATDPGAAGDGASAAAAPPSPTVPTAASGGGAGSAAPLVAVAAVIAALLGWAARLRRRRTPPTSP